MSFASVARTRVAATPGWSIGSARTSACAAGRAAGTCSSSDAISSAGSSRSRRAVTRPDRRGHDQAPAARPRDGRGRHRAAGGGPARGLPQQRVPASLAVAGVDPDRRQHGPLRADHHRQLDRLQDRGQPPHPDLPRAGRAVLGGRRRLRRPDRPAADPDRDQRPARSGLRGAVPGRHESRGHPAAQHRDLDDHRVLRAGRAGDDPGARAARHSSSPRTGSSR